LPPAKRPSPRPDGKPRVRTPRLRAAASSLLAVAVFVPGLAATATVALYLQRGRDFSAAAAYFWGTPIGLAAGLVLLPAVYRYAWAHRANPAAYGLLREFYTALAERADGLDIGQEANSNRRCAHREACANLRYVGGELGLYAEGLQPSFGLRWVLASGYVDLWRSLHRAEEALLLASRPADLVGEAVFDDLRLEGSRLAQVAELRRKLRTAVATISGATPYMPPTRDATQSEPQGARELAGAALSAVRRTINEYRDDRRDGLVRSRNNLFAAVIFASVMAYVLLGVLMVGPVAGDAIPRKAVAAGTAFYVVGALVGLYRNLQVASSAIGVAEEDFGLQTARLINIPVLSGLAGLGGVVLTALLPQATGANESINVSDVFDLNARPQNLLTAAVFGLAPGLLLQGLQRRGEQFKKDLKTTEPGEREAG
jgi:hypothetical protein